MGKKRQFDWREAKKLCRLNQNDIAMAKALAFGPARCFEQDPTPNRSGNFQ
jgi:hypothetical protein